MDLELLLKKYKEEAGESPEAEKFVQWVFTNHLTEGQVERQMPKLPKREYRVSIVSDSLQSIIDMARDVAHRAEQPNSIRPMTLIGKSGLVMLHEQYVSQETGSIEKVCYPERVEKYVDMEGNVVYRKGYI